MSLSHHLLLHEVGLILLHHGHLHLLLHQILLVAHRIWNELRCLWLLLLVRVCLSHAWTCITERVKSWSLSFLLLLLLCWLLLLCRCLNLVELKDIKLGRACILLWATSK